MDFPHLKLPEHRVKSSLFNVVNESQRQMNPPVLTHEVTNTEFEMKYPDRLLLSSSGQEWQSDIATDS